MGTRLLNQRRGKGSPAFKTPSHRFHYNTAYAGSKGIGQVTGFVDDPARKTLTVEITFEDGTKIYNIAAEGLAKGDRVHFNDGSTSKATAGSVMPLSAIADGTPVYNLENKPGDGGKLTRSSGASAYVLAHDEETGLVSVQLASKAVKKMLPGCRATIGVACGGGRPEKPFKKAGARYYDMKGRNKYYPKVRGTAMSAYDHPHGGKSFGKSTTVARGTPPGRKVGQIAARRVGRRRGKQVKGE